LKKLEKIFNISGSIGGIVLFCVAVLITLDTLVRFIFNKSIVGVYEITEVSFLVLSFMAFAVTQYRENNIRIDILQTRIKKGRFYYFLNILNDIVVFIFFAIVIRGGMEAWRDAYVNHYERSGIVAIPDAIHLSFVVLGSLLMLIATICTIVKSFRMYIHTDLDSKTETN
jgi:TRAP-type C4-dicarboxylate transport system permease small subunit